jgi:hypothetical protein
MRKYKMLSLVFRGKEKVVIIPLKEITQIEYDKWRRELGIPVGRMETYIDLLAD